MQRLLPVVKCVGRIRNSLDQFAQIVVPDK